MQAGLTQDKPAVDGQSGLGKGASVKAPGDEAGEPEDAGQHAGQRGNKDPHGRGTRGVVREGDVRGVVRVRRQGRLRRRRRRRRCGAEPDPGPGRQGGRRGARGGQKAAELVPDEVTELHPAAGDE